VNSAYAHYPSLADRVVLVTGGASGIGASMVEHFLAQGAKVAFLDIDQEAGKVLAATLAKRGPHDPLFIACDICDIDALQAAIARVRTHFGPIAVLVNNAANDLRHGMDTVSVASWDAGIAVNLRHQFSRHRRLRQTCARSAAGPSSTLARSAG
jgi:D-xylose 1-dehydrogenase